MKRCKTKRCKNLTKSQYCTSCRVRKHRISNKIKYAFQTLKDNAKRRGKSFTLTLEQFTEFAIKTNYIAGKGRNKEAYSVDRIKEDKGYEKENLQILSVSQNVTKFLHYNWQTKQASVQTITIDNSENPF